MKRTLIFTAILVLSITKMHAQDMHARVDSLMNFYVNEYNFNGVALVASKGDIIFEQSYGYRDIGKKIKHDDQSIFQVGMLTTQFTAELIFQLATENKLNLDDKIEKYFPKYPKGDTITIRNLLTNTSGILDYFIFDGYFMKHDTLHVAQDSLMQLFENKPTQVKPGTRYH
jgi:CubicO group peptidase (beta-lactamase class C family)